MEDLQRKIISVQAGIIIFVIISQLLSCFSILANGQSEITFTAADKFEIPSNNSSVRFTNNGTYEMTSLENRVWSFENLRFFNYQGMEKLNLKVSATDCDVTISYYLVYNGTFGGENVKRARLSYTVSGPGTQIFNFGLDPSMGNLDVRLNGEWVGRNHGWTVSPDGTLNITGATANVTLLYYGYPDSFGNSPNFFDEHSVVIISTFSVVIVVFLAIFITRRRNELK